ncbi:hypothetical protein OG552_18665 [Streptomyces sp. NBC_01476]|uniref:hypothetical protein n=1 Tax=Streptomyces sp. NBC_01476 TaxID=2903881 RepID=UPI002E35FE7A|nr:hypothetical protein [Streptomyces sp. NBC_01476]
MRSTAGSSWAVRVDQWPQRLDIALWLREFGRIAVPPGDTVPGPLDVPVPLWRNATGQSAGLTAGWLGWWNALLSSQDRPTPGAAAAGQLAFDPPGFAGLDEWPELQDLVLAGWREANDWHQWRKETGLAAGHRHSMVVTRAIGELENRLGRRARPFTIALTVLPVRETTVRQVAPDHFLVPERVYLGPDFPELMQSLAAPLA